MIKQLRIGEKYKYKNKEYLTKRLVENKTKKCMGVLYLDDKGKEYYRDLDDFFKKFKQ